MQTNNILSASLIDLIFDGRNKEYGAYDLRKTYSQRIKKSLVATILFVSLAVGGAVLANSAKKTTMTEVAGPGLIITEIDEEKREEKIPEEVKPKKVEEQVVKTEKLTPPVITPDDEVKVPPPSQDDLKDARIGEIKVDGKPFDGIDKPDFSGVDDGKGIIEPPAKKVSDEPFTAVEIDAKYIGNWKAFLERNLVADVATDNGAPTGRYSVVIRFVVDVEGNVSNIQPLTEHGFGMEAEAIRALKKATKWEPAIQNGMKVKAYKRQVIIFDVQNDG